MISIVKLIIGVCTTLTFNSTVSSASMQEHNQLTAVYASNAIVKDSKVVAFQILDTKCNVCHNTRNRKRVFTLENMNPWANDIYRQVFIKKRMPKGKKVKLNTKEYQELLTWITSTKTSTHGI